MKCTIKIDLVAAALVAAACVIAVMLILFISSVAKSQTPHPDVPLAKTGGVYNIGCVTPSDLDLADLCFVRSDLAEVAELGCLPSPDPDTEYRLDLSVHHTANDDAEIRCYVVDTDGNVGDLSDNAGLVDFTRPGKGRVVVIDRRDLIAARHRMPDQFKMLLLEVVD